MLAVVLLGAALLAADVPTIAPFGADDPDALVAWALATQPSLRAAASEQSAAVERIRQAGSLPDPMFMWAEMLEGPGARMLSV